MRLIPADTTLTTGEAWTIGFTYFTLAIPVSILHSTAGTEAWVIVAATLLVNSATATLAFAGVTAAGGGTVSGVVSGWLVSTRFGLMAAALGPRLWPSKKRRALAAFAAFDPNVALAAREADDTSVRRVYVSITLWLVIPWWIGAVVGIVIGERLGDPNRLGLDAMFPALFVAILWPQLKSGTARTIAAVAAVIAMALVEPSPGGLPVLLAAAVALLAIRDVP